MTDMMMSERPSGVSGMGSSMGPSGSMGGGAPAVSIGNYKGVMLCNRPFAGVAAAAHGARGADGKKQPFRSAVVPHEALGLNPAREQRRVGASGPKKNKNSALSRHKKWLYQLQKAKEQYQQQAEEQAQQEEEQRRKFAEQQAALRAQVKETLEVAVDAAENELNLQNDRRLRLEEEREERRTKTLREEAQEREEQKRIEAEEAEMYAQKYDETEVERAQREEQLRAARRQQEENEEDAKWFDEGKEGEAVDQQQQQQQQQQNLSQAQQQKLNNKNKPAWAMTQEAKEAMEDQEADDLLDFAQNLNIDEYLDDFEVRAALEAVQERINAIEESKDRGGEKFEEKYDGDDEEYGVPKYRVPEPEDMERRNDLTLGMGGGSAKVRYKKSGLGKLTKDTLAAMSNQDGDQQQSFDTKSVRSAASVLSEVKSLRGIHSARSLAALTRQTAKEMGMQRMPVIQESNKAFKPPKIVVCDETAGVREEIRKQPGQLPYMHRNPAV
jgi:hypothetical protein